MKSVVKFAIACFLLLHSTLTFATEVYVAQSAAGGATGTSCANAKTVASVNGAMAAGNNYHLCGTVTTTNISPGGNGSPGNLIGIIFETGASITVSACGTNGCLNLNGTSYILVDGSPTATACGYVLRVDTACNGTIAATGNGTGSGGGDSIAINMMSGANHIEVRNINLINMYVHTGLPGNDNQGGTYYGVHMNAGNNFIHNIICHDNMACVVGEAGTNNGEISFSQMYNENWGVFLSGPSTSTPDSITLNKIHDNDIHDMVNWDTSGNTYHHNGIIVAGNNNLANGVSHTDIYNNYVHGNPSACSNSCATAYIFVNDANTTRWFNNLAVQTTGSIFPNGLFYSWSPGTLQFTDLIANNTIIGISGAGSDCVSVRGDASMTFENNIISGCSNALVNFYTSPSTTFTALDFNTYQDASLSGVWQHGSNFFSTIAAWRTEMGAEASSQAQTTSLNLNSNYVPNAGSSVIGAGVNLTSLGIAALNTDACGIGRPAAGAWDAGYCQFSIAPVPNPPTNYHFIFGQ